MNGGYKTWLYAGTSEYPTLLVSESGLRARIEDSENPFGADNQQETETHNQRLDP